MISEDAPRAIYIIANIERLLSAETVQYICVHVGKYTAGDCASSYRPVTSTLLHTFSTETTKFFLIKRNWIARKVVIVYYI